MCNGQILPINMANSALFSLLGTTYGGNGTTTFALPDLRGRTPMHPGQGIGLTNRVQGEFDGTESVTLLQSEIPAHTHSVGAAAANGDADAPAARVPARAPSAIPQYAPAPDTSLAPSAIGAAGGGEPHNNMQPSLTVTFIIALQGFYPPRP
jgi:microcystin-dependent protein